MGYFLLGFTLGWLQYMAAQAIAKKPLEETSHRPGTSTSVSFRQYHPWTPQERNFWDSSPRVEEYVPEELLECEDHLDEDEPN